MEKCRSILLKLRDHLMVNYPDLTTWTLNHDGKDLAPPLIHKDPKSSSFFLIVTLKSKQDLAMADIQPADNVVDAKVSRLPWTSKSFKLVFYPVIIVSQDKSCRCFLAVSLVSHQGHRIKNDFATFTLNYSPDEQDVLTTEAEISPTLSETTLSNCDLLTKVSVLSSDGFTLCSGLKHKFNKSLQTQSVYIEPTPDGEFLVRSRNCNFITELQEMYSKDTSSSRSNLSCTKCCEMDKALEIEVLEQKLEPIETDLMTDSSVKIENFLSDFPEVESPCEDSIDQQTSVKSTKCLKKLKTQQGSAKHLASSCGVTEEVQKIYFEDIEVKNKDHINISSDPISKEKILATKRRRKIPKKSKSKKDSEHFEGKASEFSETCVVCLRTFHTEITFTKHLEAHKERIHDWESKTQCPVWECDQTFPNRLELNVHFISVHKNDQFSEKIPCAFCLKIIQRDKIRSHFRGEHPQKKFSCTECGRECLFPSQLKQHWKDMHDPENSKDYVCHLCGNIYARKTGLKQHMASQHSDDRDFKCDYCGKGFTNVQRLRQHVRIHTGVKPFKCKICEYRSNRSDNVLFHLRKVHKIEKPTVVSNVDVFEEQLS